jgi:hypothetical protein
LLNRFSALGGPAADGQGALFPVGDPALVAHSLTLAGADNCIEIELWGGEQLAFLSRFVPYRHGVPNYDTLNGVLAAIDPDTSYRAYGGSSS